LPHIHRKKENGYEKPPHKARVWQAPSHRLKLRLPNTCFFALARLDFLLTVLFSVNSHKKNRNINSNLSSSYAEVFCLVIL
ncbi:MAG: hypothetical protein AB7O47_10760, partial [Flavobacteriales bacterium]